MNLTWEQYQQDFRDVCLKYKNELELYFSGNKANNNHQEDLKWLRKLGYMTYDEWIEDKMEERNRKLNQLGIR